MLRFTLFQCQTACVSRVRVNSTILEISYEEHMTRPCENLKPRRLLPLQRFLYSYSQEKPTPQSYMTKPPYPAHWTGRREKNRLSDNILCTCNITRRDLPFNLYHAILFDPTQLERERGVIPPLQFLLYRSSGLPFSTGKFIVHEV